MKQLEMLLKEFIINAPLFFEEEVCVKTSVKTQNETVRLTCKNLNNSTNTQIAIYNGLFKTEVILHSYKVPCMIMPALVNSIGQHVSTTLVIASKYTEEELLGIIALSL